MEPQARQRLADDHHAVDKVLQQLLAALHDQNIQTSYSKLDLLWARLAVHIRAEHLHLFPTVIGSLTKSNNCVPELSEAQAIVRNLRADHDFFMSELARAIRILRKLRQGIVTPNDEEKFAAVGNVIREIERRLAKHNEIEESQIYRWSSTILTLPDRLDLLARINTELKNHPPRFSEMAWTNRL